MIIVYGCVWILFATVTEKMYARKRRFRENEPSRREH